MKTIKLQGKDYIQVSERLKYFRETYKDGRIDTSYQILDGRVVFNAKVYDGDKLISSGTGMKNTAKEFELEKAETRAIGRALAIAGIGLDAGIASYDEMADFYRQEKQEDKPKKQEDKPIELATVKQLDLIRRHMETNSTLITEYMKKEFNKTMLPALTKDEASKVITLIKGKEIQDQEPHEAYDKLTGGGH